MLVGVLPASLVEDYFLSLGLQSVALLLLCAPEETKVKLLRSFSRRNIATTFSERSVLEPSAQRMGAVIDISCESSSVLLQKLSDKKVFNMRTEFLLVEAREGSRPERLGELNFPTGSCVTLTRAGGGWADFYEVYRVVMWREMQYLHVSRQRLASRFRPLPPRSGRTDFQGVTLRAVGSVLYKDQFAGLNSLRHTEADPYLHVGLDLSYNFGEHYNFSFSILLTEAYGFKVNGSFTGMMGYFQRSEMDFSFTGLMMRYERFEFVEFAGNTYQVMSPLIFRQPSLPTVSNIFTLPFTLDVWLALILLSILTTSALLVDLITSIKILKYAKSAEIPSGEVVMTVIGHISQQGPSLVMKTRSSEITLLLFSFFSFFISIAYSAKIVALLQSSTNSIKTLPQLIDSPLTVLIQDVIYNKVFLEESTSKDVKDLMRNKVMPNGASSYVNPYVGLHKVKSGLYAYKVDSNWAYKLIAETYYDREKCGLSEMGLLVLPMMSIGLPKNSGLREHFSRMMAWEWESGLYRRIRARLMSPKPRCNSKGGYATVGLREFRPALAALVYGTCLALALFLLELIANLRFQFIRPPAVPVLGIRRKDRAKFVEYCNRRFLAHKL